MPERKLIIVAAPIDSSSSITILDSNFVERTKIEHNDAINAIATNGKVPLLAFASDKTVHIWKPTRQEFNDSWKEIVCSAILPHSAPVKSVCINPAGSFLVSGTHTGKEVQFYLWDLINNTPIFSFPLHTNSFDNMPLYCSYY
jgi:WD40 repeat protein